MPNKDSLFICRQVFYLVDDVLILALGLKVNRETNNGFDGSTYTTRPKQVIIGGSSAHQHKDACGNPEGDFYPLDAAV